MDFLKDIWTFVEHDRIGRTITMVISAGIIILAGYFWFKLFVFGKSVNKNPQYSVQHLEKDSLLPKKVTGFKLIKHNDEFLKSKKMKQQEISNKDAKTSKTEVNTNSGTNLGNIGGNNNSVTNNFKTPPRIVTQEIVDDLMENLPNKAAPISFYRNDIEDPESLDFANQLIKRLQDSGYSNVGLGGQMSNGIPKGKFFKYDDLFGTTLVAIPKNY